MKSIIALLFTSCISGSAVLAQSLSIEELWSNTASYEKAKQAQASVALAKLKVKSEQLKRLPLIYGEGNLQRNLIIPATPVPAIAFDPNASPGDILPLKFATDWTAKGGVQFSFDIYNPQKAVGVETADLERRTAEIDYEKELLDRKKKSTAAYAKVIIATKQYEAARGDSALYAQIVAVVAERVKSGRALELDLNRARQELINKRTLVSESFQVLQMASIDLSRFIDTERYHTLSSSIDDIISKLKDENQQLVLRRLALNREQIELEQANVKWEALPTFTLNAFYGSQYFSNQLRLFEKSDWFGNSYVTLGVKLPLSEAVDRNLKKKQLALEKQRVESQYREQLQLNSASRREHEATLSHARTKLANAREVEALSTKNTTLVRDRYEAGKTLLIELNEELSTHFKNKQNVWQAENDYVQALVEAYLK